MPRLRVIILDQPDPTKINCLFWLDVPAARQRFYAGIVSKSVWLDALQADNDALASGAMVEMQVLYSPDGGLPGLATIESQLGAMWTGQQNAINGVNRWGHYGSNWDGTTWTAVTVA